MLPGFTPKAKGGPGASEEGLQTKFSSHSSSKQTSSKQTSTDQAPAGCEDIVGCEDGGVRDSDRSIGSGWHPEPMRASPFTAYGLQDKYAVERKDSGQFAITPPDSCTEEELQCRPLARHGSLRSQGAARTKSKLLAEIADGLSRNSQMHSRKSSAGSQDQLRREKRKRRALYMHKAFSAPGEEAGSGLEPSPEGSHSPCESGNWSQQTYTRERPDDQPQSGNRSELAILRSRTPSRKRYTGRTRTSNFIGVGSSNRKTQWQARIVVQGKVTHLGYYSTEAQAARVYDQVALSLNPEAQTNFPASSYSKGNLAQFSGLTREDLQRALGVKPMDKSSRFRGVSRKKGKWEAKVMVNRKWAFRALFDSEDEAAHAYDAAVWRLKPQEATSFVNFKNGVSVRNLPPKFTKQRAQEPQSKPKVKQEADAEPGETAPLTLTEMHIPSEQDDGPTLSDPDVIPSQPLRSQSVQLPIFGSEMAHTEARVALPVISTLNQAPSLPSNLGLGRQGSMLDAAAIPLSPQHSLCDQNGLPTLPVLPTLPPPSVPVMPNMDLPDPNSIALPPPENLPFPELVAAGGAELVSTRGSLGRSISSGPSQSLTRSELFTAQRTYSPSCDASSVLPPLPRHGSFVASEGPARYVSGNLGCMTGPGTPRSPYNAEANPTANPFQQASTVAIETGGISSIGSLDRQASMMASVELAPVLHRSATEGFPGESTELPYPLPLPELGTATPLTASLSHMNSLASINTGQYQAQTTAPCVPACATPSVDSLYSSQGLSQPPPGMSQVDPFYAPVQNFANSRSASSSFLHSAGANNLLQTGNSSLLRTTSATCSSLPMLGAPEMALMGHAMSSLPGQLGHAVSLDTAFITQPKIGDNVQKAMTMPIPETKALNPEQADLLRNLDVDVEACDPVPINPVQIGGENMNVYSAHIMGEME